MTGSAPEVSTVSGSKPSFQRKAVPGNTHVHMRSHDLHVVEISNAGADVSTSIADVVDINISMMYDIGVLMSTSTSNHTNV